MIESNEREGSQLWAIILLLKLPFVLMLLILVLKFNIEPNMWWIQDPAIAISLAIVVLPFFWKGSLGARAIAERVIRPSDRISIVLAVVPIIAWAISLYALTARTNHPFSFHLPLWLFQLSKVQFSSLLFSFVPSICQMIGVLILVNASKFSDRVKFITILFGIGILIRILQYGWVAFSMRGIPPGPASEFFSPIPDVLNDLGKLVVILALMQRGKSSVKAIATFLSVHWLFGLFGNVENWFGNVLPVAIGLVGGGALIWVVNFLQQNQDRQTPSSEMTLPST